MDKKALYKLTYGLFLLTSQADDRDNGCIINTAIQAANDPTRISICVIKQNLTCDYILRSGIFNVSAITENAAFPLFQRFGMQSGRDLDKFADFDGIARSDNGLYYLTDANMYLSARVTEQHDLGSHMLFLGELTDARVLGDAASCSYAYYQSTIKPKPQKTAERRWVCNVCGYNYAGESIPADFLCPLCSHGPEDFSLVEGSAPEAAASKSWKCSVCGYVHEGDTPPETCPLCKVPADRFTAL